MVVALTALIFGKFCLGSYIVHRCGMLAGLRTGRCLGTGAISVLPAKRGARYFIAKYHVPFFVLSAII